MKGSLGRKGNPGSPMRNGQGDSVPSPVDAEGWPERDPEDESPDRTVPPTAT